MTCIQLIDVRVPAVSVISCDTRDVTQYVNATPHTQTLTVYVDVIKGQIDGVIVFDPVTTSQGYSYFM